MLRRHHHVTQSDRSDVRALAGVQLRLQRPSSAEGHRGQLLRRPLRLDDAALQRRPPERHVDVRRQRRHLDRRQRRLHQGLQVKTRPGF